MTAPNFRATPAALGYAYQVRYGLLEAWRMLAHKGYDWTVFVESADDVVKHTDDSSDYVQLKNRSIGTSLTDYSPDLWKSLRIWSVGVSDGTIDLESTNFFLVTTSGILPLSVASYLTDEPSSRDETAALDALDRVSEEGANKALEKSYKAWSDLKPQQRQQLVSRITVVGSSPGMHEIEISLKNMAATSVRPNRVVPFLERLDGWWNQRVIEDWILKKAQGVSGIEFADKLEDIRSQMSPQSLPVEPWISDLELDESDYSHKVFVKQLEIAGIKEQRTAMAIRDWLRAIKQRSVWSKEHFVQFGELERYDKVLVDEWKYKFEGLREDLDDDSPEPELLKAARELYRWAEDAKVPPIRRDFTTTFVIRGSYHILADEEVIGWHLRYPELLHKDEEAAKMGQS